MRRFLLLIIAGLVLAAGCLGPEQPQNQTNGTNITNETNVTPEPVCAGPVCGSDGVTYDTDCIAQYANVSIIHEGACVENCTDSDGGAQPDVAGAVIKGEDTFYDYCIDEQQLAEYICTDNEPEMATINCGEDKECSRDRCVKKPPGPPPNVTLECVGPSEADILVNESVSYNNSIYVDYCIEFDVVKDYFCKDNKLDAINHECPSGYGCQFGRCEKQYLKCTDSDGGNDTSKRGRIIVTKGIDTMSDKWDECIDTVTLREYYCAEDNSSASQDIDCGSGFKCFEDRCVKSECSETDGGLNIYKKGTTTAGEEEFTDECVDFEEIREYYCYGDEIRFKVEHCGPGYICNMESYRCVEGEVSD
ncbi:MAG: hypothetical protein PHF60_05505 [Candidatus ainarchaeum sp.]|nr:hypothetical protein [Candidatus ainarchaeum sp.]